MAITPDQLTSEERKTYNRLRRDEPWADNETLAQIANIESKEEDISGFDEYS